MVYAHGTPSKLGTIFPNFLHLSITTVLFKSNSVDIINSLFLNQKDVVVPGGEHVYLIKKRSPL